MISEDFQPRSAFYRGYALVRAQAANETALNLSEFAKTNGNASIVPVALFFIDRFLELSKALIEELAKEAPNDSEIDRIIIDLGRYDLNAADLIIYSKGIQ